MSPCWPKPAPNEERGLSAGSRSACASLPQPGSSSDPPRAGGSATGPRAGFAAKALLGHAQADPKTSPASSVFCSVSHPAAQQARTQGGPKSCQGHCSHQHLSPALGSTQPNPASPTGHLNHSKGTAISTTRCVSSLEFRARREGAQHAAGRWE